MGNGWLCLFGLYYDKEECVGRGAWCAGRAMVVELLLSRVVMFSLEKLWVREVATICLEFTSLCGGEGLMKQNRSG